MLMKKRLIALFLVGSLLPGFATAGDDDKDKTSDSKPTEAPTEETKKDSDNQKPGWMEWTGNTLNTPFRVADEKSPRDRLWFRLLRNYGFVGAGVCACTNNTVQSALCTAFQTVKGLFGMNSDDEEVTRRKNWNSEDSQ